MKSTLHFSRFEFKYVLPTPVRNELESELQYFLELDPYVSAQQGSRYLVRSLYFDNQPMQAYYEKIDGMMHRSKYRVRTYTSSQDEECACFLEIKGRYNALVFKHRVPLKGYGAALISDESGATDGAAVLREMEEGPLKQQLLGDLERKRLLPQVVIDYYRRPYISKYDPEFRLTFDEELAGTRSRRLFPKTWDTRRKILSGYTILELKFRHQVPKWFHRVVQAFELRRVSVSKYCAGVDVLEMATRLE